MTKIAAIVITIIITGCTTINPYHPVIEPPTELSIGIMIDEALPITKAHDLLLYAQEHMWKTYQCKITYPWIQGWRRPGFTYKPIWTDVRHRPLMDADRLLVLVSRDWRDALWGMIFGEINGGVAKYDLKRGFVVAEIGSLNQILSFMFPKRMIIHEIQHMRGFTD